MLLRNSLYFQESDGLAEALEKWDARFTALEPENTPHKLDIISSESSVIQKLYLGQRVNIQTATPKEVITFGFPSETKERVYVNNEVINQSIVLFSSNQEHESVTPAGYSPTAISIKKNHLASLAENFELNVDIETLDASHIVNSINAIQRLEVRQYLNSALNPTSICDDGPTKIMQQDLPLLLLSLLNTNTLLNKKSVINDYLSLTRAKKFINNNALCPISISDICKAAYIHERTLERTFKKYIGLTPSAYLRSVRLGVARVALKNGNNTCNISKISLECGFMHAGRFSNYYRDKYGETPRQTLMKYGRKS